MRTAVLHGRHTQPATRARDDGRVDVSYGQWRFVRPMSSNRFPSRADGRDAVGVNARDCTCSIREDPSCGTSRRICAANLGFVGSWSSGRLASISSGGPEIFAEDPSPRRCGRLGSNVVVRSIATPGGD